MTKEEAKGRTFSVSETDLANWIQEFQRLQIQQAEIQQKINNIHQDILFAQRRFHEQNGTNVQQTVQTFILPMMPPMQNSPQRSPGNQGSPKLPDIIMSFFPVGGTERKTKAEIKKALKDSGFTKLGSNDAYFYTTMKRLLDKGQLTRDGEFYSRKLL